MIFKFPHFSNLTLLHCITAGFTHEAQENRLVWMSVEAPQPVETASQLPVLGEHEDFSKRTATIQAASNQPRPFEDQQKLEQIERAFVTREIPAELKKLSRQEIRNLERKNPELLLKTCFWKIEDGEKLTPIENPGELKAGDSVMFSIEDAAAKNKHLEMGAGLRTLPNKFNVVQIDNEKFYRIYDDGPFVDAKGNYRAVRSYEKESIALTDEKVPQEIKENISKNESDFRKIDASNLFSEFAKSTSDLESPEFMAKIEQAKKENPELAEYLNVPDKDLARLNLLSKEASVSLRNNNPGNLKYIGQAGAIGADKRGFARFATLEAGISAHKNQIRIDANRDFTILEFTKKYLGMDPNGKITNTAEGDALTYAKVISNNPDMKLTDLIDRKGISTVQKAMQEHEGWEGPENLKS